MGAAGHPWRIARLTATVGALAVLLPATALAELRWHPVQEIASGPSVMTAEVAVDARGDALAMWSVMRGPRSFEIFYSWRTPHGAWGPPTSLPSQLKGTQSQSFAVSPRGEAIVAYRIADGRVGVATGTPGQPLALSQALGGPDPNVSYGFGPLAVDDEGGVSFGWSGSDRAVYVATRRPGGRFRSPQKVGTDVLGLPPQVAVNGAGAGVVTWLAANPARTAAAYRLPGAAEFGPPETVPIAPGFAQVSIDDAGTALIASDAIPLGGGPRGTTLSERPAVGSFGPPQLLNTGTVGALLPEPGGSLSILSELTEPDGRRTELVITGRSRAGALTAPAVLSSAPSCGPKGATSPAGDLLVAYWHPCPDAFAEARGAALRLRRSPTSGFDAPVVFDGLTGGDPALTGTGEGIVVFNRNEFSASSMAFEDLDRPVPPLPTEVKLDARSVGLAKDGKVGLRVRCPVKCKVRPTGILITPSKLTASKRTGQRRLKAKKRTAVRVRFSSARVAQARRALKRGERVTLSYTVTTTGRSARALTQSRMVRLRLKR